MKVVYIEKPGKIELVDKEKPVPKKGEALLKIKYCGICGADVATFTGNQPFTTYPRIPGHEFSAEIIEIEENNLGLKVGDIVTANPYFNCGSCYSCNRGIVNACTSNETMGVQRDGSFAEYITMPIERIYSGKGLSAKTLALIEPFSIGYHASKRGNIKPDHKVLVIGAGAIGIFAAISAKLKGATVYISDVFEKRLENALKFGIDGTIDVSKENLEEKTKELTNGNGFDVCIEAVGQSSTFLDCINCAAFGADIILIGNGKKETTFNHSILLKKELNIYGSRNALKSDFLELIDFISSGKISVDGIVSDIFDKEDALKAFDSLVHNDGSKFKVLVKMS
ncbi:zinc-binding alcohol dehydrogenase family protein [Fusobacterium mortiferum]|jgi:2-desacetyl-2-hydroxyethyl bacteriochlorophyllide A dehydrogenase|uniref:zinc-binding alcohol dehydrogenase family protein n=1 Tax=Fusobacterium mortiferum TaxID=850 RepID=UPI0019560F12|nr:zinc-binding alcohol dehydrogenase family protein [Fusobacterium mortiferum]